MKDEVIFPRMETVEAEIDLCAHVGSWTKYYAQSSGNGVGESDDGYLAKDCTFEALHPRWDTE